MIAAAGPDDDQALGFFLDAKAAGGQARRHQGDAVAFLDPHFANAGHAGDAGGEGRRHGQDRNTRRSWRAPARRHIHAGQGRIPSRNVAHRLAALVADVFDGQVGDHFLQGREEAGAQGI